MLKLYQKNPKGFTLIEILVSVAIFAIVMVISLGALLAMSESDRKAQTLKSVINNLNFSLDSISRAIRTGQNYHCDITQTPLAAPLDCAVSPGTSIAFVPSGGGTTMYKFESASASICGQSGTVGCITRSTDGGATFAAITAPEVVVSSMKFYVTGAQSAGIQPKVTILLSGVVAPKGVVANCGGQSSASTCFNLQTTVTQRLYDQ